SLFFPTYRSVRGSKNEHFWRVANSQADGRGVWSRFAERLAAQAQHDERKSAARRRRNRRNQGRRGAIGALFLQWRPHLAASEAHARTHADARFALAYSGGTPARARSADRGVGH